MPASPARQQQLEPDDLPLHDHAQTATAKLMRREGPRPLATRTPGPVAMTGCGGLPHQSLMSLDPLKD
jgi:hypothetical protein